METNRLEAFSDGVFAIAITLLILEIKVPPPGTGLGAELLQLWPSYLAYVVSFLVIGAIWINHHAMLPWLAVLLFILLNLFYLWPRWGHKTDPSRIDDLTVSSDRSEND